MLSVIKKPRIDYLVIIQARIGSTRLPGKCLMTVGGVPMVKRVWDVAKRFESIQRTYGKTVKVVVGWPERYPDLDENKVLERFQRLSQEFPSKAIIRLTSDCPLLTVNDILNAEIGYWAKEDYYSNHYDGHDVQIFKSWVLWSSRAHKEHVIADFSTPNTGLSVNTKEDLERVRRIVDGK